MISTSSPRCSRASSSDRSSSAVVPRGTPWYDTKTRSTPLAGGLRNSRGPAVEARGAPSGATSRLSRLVVPRFFVGLAAGCTGASTRGSIATGSIAGGAPAPANSKTYVASDRSSSPLRRRTRNRNSRMPAAVVVPQANRGVGGNSEPKPALPGPASKRSSSPLDSDPPDPPPGAPGPPPPAGRTATMAAVAFGPLVGSVVREGLATAVPDGDA